MTIEEFRQNAAISAMQAIIEGKGGIIYEIDAAVCSDAAIRIAEALTTKYFEKYHGK